MQRRFFSGLPLLLLSLGVSLLTACSGGSDSSGTASLRLAHIARTYGALDLHTVDSSANDKTPIAAVAANTVSDYTSIGSGTYTVNLKAPPSSAVASTSSRTLSNDTSYTLLSYYADTTLRTAMLSDSEDAPTSGTTKVRVINLAVEAGSLDVYVTPVGDSIDGLSPNFGARATENISSYSEITKGSYQIHVTGAGDQDDLRLVIPSVELVDGQVLSLVFTSTAGGLLVDGYTLVQKGKLTAFRNGSTRVRLVAAGAMTSLSATLNGTALNNDTLAPGTVDRYRLVSGGAVNLSVSAGGAALTHNLASQTLAGGTEWSLIVFGTTASPQFLLQADENRTSSSVAKIRLVNVATGLASGVTFKVNSATLEAGIGEGKSTQDYYEVPGSTKLAAIEALVSDSTKVGSTRNLFDGSADITLANGGVYTLFLMGDGSNATAQLSKDR